MPLHVCAVWPDSVMPIQVDGHIVQRFQTSSTSKRCCCDFTCIYVYTCECIMMMRW